jgi:ABC-2 type transport system permease protein
MNQTLTIAKRELMSLLYSPVGYVVTGLFALVAAMVFFLSFDSGMEATLRPTLAFMVWTLIFLAPAISMRLISDEFRSGTIEVLMTTPLSDTQVVIGKWLGAFAFFAVLIAVTLVVLLGILIYSSDPDWGPIVTQILGMLLVGGLYLAIGTAASAATQNQIIAFLLTVFIVGLLTLGVGIVAQASFVTPWMRSGLFYLGINKQFEEFNKGVIDTSSLIYFITGIAMFLFIAVKLLESKRWR